MRFAPTDDQLALRDAVRDLLAKECPPEVVRAAWPDGTDALGARKGEGARAPEERVERVWSTLAEMGVLGVAVPEAQGGLGMAEVDWVLVAEETGYAALPHPFVETAAVAAPLLAAAGDPEGLVPSLVDGSRRVAVLPLGTRLVPWGDVVTLLVGLDVAADGTWTARRIASAVAQGEARTPADVVDAGRRTVLLEAWRAGAVIGTAADAALAFDRGALGIAAQLVGLARRMVDLAVGYVGERKQFGVPVGSFQAVKHHLADAALRIEFAAPAVHAAAWSLATGAPTASRDVSMAKALASDAGRLAGRTALQVHGAIGYTTEYDLHLYLKRAEVLARTWGDAAWHRRRIATALDL